MYYTILVLVSALRLKAMALSIHMLIKGGNLYKPTLKLEPFNQ